MLILLLIAKVIKTFDTNKLLAVFLRGSGGGVLDSTVHWFRFKM